MTVGALALFTGKTQQQFVAFDGCHKLTLRAKKPNHFPPDSRPEDVPHRRNQELDGGLRAAVQ